MLVCTFYYRGIQRLSRLYPSGITTLPSLIFLKDSKLVYVINVEIDILFSTINKFL